MEQAKKKLTFTQILTRIVSVVICAIGVSACVFSLTLQVEEIGTAMSSFVWFSGLAGVVASLGGYASSCNPRQGTSGIVIALVIGAVLMVGLLRYELLNMRSYDVAFFAIGAVVVEAVWLIIYHFILKHQDPEAA